MTINDLDLNILTISKGKWKAKTETNNHGCPTYISLIGATKEIIPIEMRYAVLISIFGALSYSLAQGIPSLLKDQNKAMVGMFC